MKYLAKLLTFHLVFLVYLLVSGTGLARAGQVWKKAFVEAGALFIVALLVMISFATQDVLDVLPWMLLIASALMLPFAALRVVPDVVVPRTGLVEVVLTNVAALALAGVRVHAPYLPDFVPSLIGWLLNPFQLLVSMPPAMATVICLWPSLLAVALAWRGPPGDPRLRLVLVLWTQIVSLVWLLPVAVSAIVKFDGSTLMAYAQSVLACAATVHVVLLAINLRRAIGGEKRAGHVDPAKLTRGLADSLVVDRWPWWIFVAGGALAYFGAVKLRSLPIDPVLVVSTAYLAAIVLGAIALRFGASADGEGARAEDASADERRKPAAPIRWRSYRGTLFGAIVGIVIMAATRYFDGLGQYLSGEGRELTKAIAAAWFIGALLALNALLVFAWIVAEAMGRKPAKGMRAIAFLLVAAMLGLWRWSVLPSPHPRGGLDSSEVAFNGARAYIWYAEENWFGGGTGRALWLEHPGGYRHKVAACGGYPRSPPVQSIRVVRGAIECRWPDRIALVDSRGQSSFASWGGIHAPKVTPERAAARACWLLDTPAVAVACAAEVGSHPMTFEPLASDESRPTSWEPARARYFTLEFAHGGRRSCIEVPARATLRDGTEGPVVFVLEFADTGRRGVRSELAWAVDRDGSCARMGEDVNGQRRYEWNRMTAPYFFESHSTPPALVPVPRPVETRSGSGQEQRPEA